MTCGKSPSEFAMLAPGLLHLKIFLESLSTRFEPNLDTSVVWGMIVLITKVHVPLQST